MKLEEDIKLIYPQAQDSAKHFDHMIWILVNIGIGLSLFLLYAVYIEKPFTGNAQILAIFLGVSLLFYFSFIIESANDKKLLNYGICKRIEKNFSYKPNILTEKLPLSNKGIIIFRLMKIILFGLYFLLLIKVKIHTYELFSYLALGALVLTILLICGAIGMEIYYFIKKSNFRPLFL